MDTQQLESLNKEELIEKIKILETELTQTKEKLKKYTSPARHKTFYENHKDEILQKSKDYYKEKVTPEKRKEYARRAYLNKKEKQKQNNLG